jgi:hypothetical protein
MAAVCAGGRRAVLDGEARNTDRPGGDVDDPEVRTASTTSSTGWPPQAPGLCATTRSTGSMTKVRADTGRPINPFPSDSFAR